MSAARKVTKQDASELELQVGQALIDLENASPDLKADLRPLQIASVRELDVTGGKKALVIFVPVPLLPNLHKVQQRVTRELEKKFSDRHVVFLADRKIIPKPGKNSQLKQKRPKSRTLTAVHDAMLEDLVYPTQIVGKRIRFQVGGHKIHKVLLGSKDISSTDYKLDSLQAVYNKLTGKSIEFNVPSGEVY